MPASPGSVRARAFALTVVLLPLSLAAQPAAPAAAPAARPEDVVKISAFEVTTTQGRGYTATNSASGFKTNQQLIDIPQPILVVTRDLIDDIGYTTMSDVLQFAGVVTTFRGERGAMRGTGASQLLDDMPHTHPYLDNANIDSYQVLRGPTSVLYIGTGIAGTIIKTSKKPLPTARRSITGSIDEHGGYRGEFDFTGPAGAIGEAKFSYRLVGASQGGEQYFKNTEDERTFVAPTLQLNYRDTTLRLAYDHFKLTHIPNANNPITPNGKLYEGAGRDEAWFPQNAMEDFSGYSVRLTGLQKLSPNWEAKVQSQFFKFYREGAVMIPGGLDWATQTYYAGARYNDQVQDFFTVAGDVIGNFELAGLKHQSAAGFAFSDERNLSRIGGRVTAAAYGTIRATGAPGFPGVIGVPLANPRLDTLRLPQLGDYVVGAAAGTRARTYRTNGYYQHSLDVIRDRLTLVGGVAYQKIEVNQVQNIAVSPATAVITPGADWLRRLGVVFRATKEISLYALESTTFSPPAGRDQNLNFLPNVQGKGQEAGVKTALWGGRVSSTISAFRQELTNQAVFGGNLPNGVSYQLPIGATKQEGFDADLSVSVSDGLQFILTGYKGKVTDQTGNQVSGTYKSSVSIFTRYDFGERGPLKGLAVGGGFVTVGGRTVAQGGATGLTNAPGNPTFFKVDGGHLVNLFAHYVVNKTWSLRLNVNNVLDDYYPLGLQGPIAADPSPPRTVSTAVTYRF